VALGEFWPNGGPHWDALAVIHRDQEEPGVLLVEAKSYPEEMYGGGTAARAGSASRLRIERSLAWTQGRLGVDPGTDWSGSLYQHANRLAYLEWLGWRGVKAWLAYLLFVDDPLRPTTFSDWEGALERVRGELALPERELDGVGHVMLAAASTEVNPTA
jgi:hypothetical protein